jgi:hypothetical protein
VCASLRQRLLVARLLPRRHRVVVGPASGERVVEGRRSGLGVAERVGDPEGGERILVVAGVADERPTGAEGLAEEARRSPIGGSPDEEVVEHSSVGCSSRAPWTCSAARIRSTAVERTWTARSACSSSAAARAAAFDASARASAARCGSS